MANTHLNFDKFLRTTIVIEEGHLDQERQKLNHAKIPQDTEAFSLKAIEQINNLFLNILRPLHYNQQAL